MVSAYRLDRTGEGLRRAVYSWVYNWLIQLSFGTRLRDINFAFKLCRRRVLEAGHAVQRGVVHRRRAGDPGAEGRVHHRADRRRLLPPHPRGVHPVLARRDPEDARRDGPAARRTQGRTRHRRRRRRDRLLVVSADDLGLTDGVCRAVLRAHATGW